MTYQEKQLIEMEFYVHAMPYLASTQGLIDTMVPNKDGIVQVQVPSTPFKLVYPRGPDQQHLPDLPKVHMIEIRLEKRVFNVFSNVVKKNLDNVVIKGLANKFSGYLEKACTKVGLVHNPQ